MIFGCPGKAGNNIGMENTFSGFYLLEERTIFPKIQAIFIKSRNWVNFLRHFMHNDNFPHFSQWGKGKLGQSPQTKWENKFSNFPQRKNSPLLENFSFCENLFFRNMIFYCVQQTKISTLFLKHQDTIFPS